MNNSYTLICLISNKVINQLMNITKEFYELSIRNQVREREAQIVAHYKARLQIVIQLKMVVAQTYTIGDAYQLTLVVEATLNF